MRVHLVMAIGLLCCLFSAVRPIHAGLHYSGETWAELPSRWPGYLLDQRLLRQVAVRPTKETPAGATRIQYQAEVTRWTKLAALRELNADEAADLGALLVRLGEVPRALEVLRPAQRKHPLHFRLAANLGTAWQLNGDLVQAILALEQAVRLAPGRYQKAEELHLRLVRLRAKHIREKSGEQPLDDLFGVRYVGPTGKYEPGKLALAQRKQLPNHALASVQMLGLWLPDDARILWQLAELAGAYGDVRTSAAILDGVVTEFGLRHPDLRERRTQARSAAELLARLALSPDKEKTHKEDHALLFVPRSARPLARSFAVDTLPAIDPRGINNLPWDLLTETTLDRRSRPTFPNYLRELDGKTIELRGYMQPLGNEAEPAAFLFVEHPIGCWYCEKPEMTGIILVELPANRTTRWVREPILVRGLLQLNPTDPENFLFLVREAVVRVLE